MQFCAGRWLVRQVLALHWQQHGDYTFTNHKHWQNQQTQRCYAVSISHSHDLVIVAVAEGNTQHGIDIEQHKTRHFSGLLQEFATPGEQTWVTQAAQPCLAFYRLWTAKEAFIKASGCSMAQVASLDFSHCLSLRCPQLNGLLYIPLSLPFGGYSATLFSNAELSLPPQDALLVCQQRLL